MGRIAGKDLVTLKRGKLMRAQIDNDDQSEPSFCDTERKITGCPGLLCQSFWFRYPSMSQDQGIGNDTPHSMLPIEDQQVDSVNPELFGENLEKSLVELQEKSCKTIHWHGESLG